MTEVDTALFAARRERFLARIGSGVAVLPTAAPPVRGTDRELRFRPDSDFWYLTGFGEPEAVAVLSPHDAENRFTLFVRPRDPERETWSGVRAGVEGARERFGADAAFPIAELPTRLPTLLAPADCIWFAPGRHPALDRQILGSLADFRRTRPRSGHGPAVLADPAPVLGAMRMLKEPGEIAALRRAADISAAAHRAAMAATRPGAGEWEVEAALEFAFRSAGAAGSAYAPIVGGGRNATVLHYTDNAQTLGACDLVLVDAGAEWGMYCADISRTWPVDGHFSAPQREAYEVVLAAQAAGIERVRPGCSVADVHEATVRVLAEGMVQLGLLPGPADAAIETGAYKRFYPHQTSHWLGLDVHDAGMYREGNEPTRLQPGMVLTVEPGLYVPEDAKAPAAFRGMGIRIEDDALVTEGGCELLTRDVPVEPDLLEDLVGGGVRE